MITGNIKLTALKHARCKMNGRDGKPVDGMFIPFGANKLEVAANGEIYLNIVAWENKTPKEFSTHMVKQNLTKAQREAMSKDELEGMPILGNLNANAQPQAQVNTDTSIDTSAPISVDNGDDLPF